MCYVVRATTGDYDEVTLKDNAPAQGGNPAPTAKETILVRAREPGDHSPDITVKASQTAANSLSVSNKKPYNPTGPTITSVSGAEIVTNDASKAARFVARRHDRRGRRDLHREPRVRSVDLRADPAGDRATLRARSSLADPVAGTTDSLQVEEPVGSKLAPGAVLKLSQAQKPDSYVVVKSVTPQRLSPGRSRTYRVELRSAIAQAYTLASLRLDSVEFKLEIGGGAPAQAYDDLERWTR